MHRDEKGYLNFWTSMVTIFTNSIKAKNSNLSNRSIYEFIIILMIDKQYFLLLYSLLFFPCTLILFTLIYEVNFLRNLRLSKSFYQCSIFIFIFILHPSEGKGCKLWKALKKAMIFLFVGKWNVKTLSFIIIQRFNIQVKIKYNL
jgi:hypothetical protein